MMYWVFLIGVFMGVLWAQESRCKGTHCQVPTHQHTFKLDKIPLHRTKKRSPKSLDRLKYPLKKPPKHKNLNRVQTPRKSLRHRSLDRFGYMGPPSPRHKPIPETPPPPPYNPKPLPEKACNPKPLRHKNLDNLTCQTPKPKHTLLDRKSCTSSKIRHTPNPEKACNPKPLPHKNLDNLACQTPKPKHKNFEAYTCRAPKTRHRPMRDYEKVACDPAFQALTTNTERIGHDLRFLFTNHKKNCQIMSTYSSLSVGEMVETPTYGKVIVAGYKMGYRVYYKAYFYNKRGDPLARPRLKKHKTRAIRQLEVWVPVRGKGKNRRLLQAGMGIQGFVMDYTHVEKKRLSPEETKEILIRQFVRKGKISWLVRTYPEEKMHLQAWLEKFAPKKPSRLHPGLDYRLLQWWN